MVILVRVYLKSEIMKNGNYKAIYHEQQGHHKYSCWNLPIEFHDGRFSIDAIDGKVPVFFHEYLTSEYSLHRSFVDGFRYSGLYRDKRYDKAEAQIKESGGRLNDNPYYSVHIEGTNLEHVLGLYKAIINDELVPVSEGASATELIEKLKTQLTNKETLIDELKDQLECQDKEVKVLRFELDEATVRIAEQQILASRPWYQKLRSWLYSIGFFPE